LERVTANAAGSHTDSFSNNYKIEVVADASFDRVQTPHWVFLVDVDINTATWSPPARRSIT
jgi:hypothetical protein